MVTHIQNNFVVDASKEYCIPTFGNKLKMFIQYCKKKLASPIGVHDKELEIMLNQLGCQRHFNKRSLKRNSAFIFYSWYEESNHPSGE